MLRLLYKSRPRYNNQDPTADGQTTVLVPHADMPARGGLYVLAPNESTNADKFKMVRNSGQPIHSEGLITNPKLPTSPTKTEWTDHQVWGWG